MTLEVGLENNYRFYNILISMIMFFVLSLECALYIPTVVLYDKPDIFEENYQEISIPQEEEKEKEEKELTEDEYFAIIDNNREERYEVKTDFEILYNNMILPLAKIIYAEGADQLDIVQQYIGYVVLNRVDSVYYANTIEDVFFCSAYATTSQERYLKGLYDEKTLENAKIVVFNYLNNNVPVSSAMVYQAEFKQGVNIIKIDNNYFGCNPLILDDMGIAYNTEE